MNSATRKFSGTSSFLNHHLFNIFLISVFYAFFITGYRVFESDQTQYMLLPFREIFTGFCQGDWFTYDTSHYHYSFSYLIRFLHLFSLGHLEIGIFVVWAAMFIGLFHSLYRLTLALGGKFIDFTVVVFLLTIYSSTSLGDSILITNSLLPVFIAIPLTMYSFSYLFEERLIHSFLFLGLAALMHVNFAVIGLPVIVVYVFVKRDLFFWKSFFFGLSAFLLLALPQLIPIALNFGKSDEWLWLAYLVRSPHHYDPMVFGINEWLVTLFPVTMSFIIYFTHKLKRREIILMSVIIGFCVLVLVNNVFVQSLSFYKIYVWRFAPFLLIFSYIFISATVFRERVLSRKVLALIILGAIFILIVNYNALTSSMKIALFVPGVYFLSKKYRNVYVYTAITISIIALSGLTQGGYKGIYIYNKNAPMEWIKNNTGSSSLLLVPPDIEGVRLNSYRPVVVNFKCAPIGVGEEMLEWKTRLEKITGISSLELMDEKGYSLIGKLTGLYLERSPDDIKDIMSEYNADYFVTYSRHQNIGIFESSGFMRVYDKDDFVIFQPVN